MTAEAARRVAVVTGGTDGIGRATALRLARGGFRVLFTGRAREKAEAVLQGLESGAPGAGHAFIQADFSRMADVRRAAGELVQAAPSFDALVHSAGIINERTELTSEGLEKNFAVNYLRPDEALVSPREAGGARRARLWEVSERLVAAHLGEG